MTNDEVRELLALTTATVQWTSPRINSLRLAGVKLLAVIALQTQWWRY